VDADEESRQIPVAQGRRKEEMAEERGLRWPYSNTLLQGREEEENWPRGWTPDDEQRW
jgi:hypothetical protein